eukprot:scaffold1769_cov132-Skeletonema_dohrnii-CCMP3373.AAC.3
MSSTSVTPQEAQHESSASKFSSLILTQQPLHVRRQSAALPDEHQLSNRESTNLESWQRKMVDGVESNEIFPRYFVPIPMSM